MPTTQAFADSLGRDLGVGGVLSLLTNIDLLTLGFDWKQMAARLGRAGIQRVERVPITDFDEWALTLALDDAVAALVRLRDAGGLATYVHCTAGVNRSPTVVIAYLVSRGATLEEAWDEVHAARRVLPIRGALERWKRRRDGLASSPPGVTMHTEESKR